MAHIDRHVAAIDSIRRWAEAESTKWRGVRGAVELFDPSEEPGDVSDEDLSEPSQPIVVVPHVNGAAARPKTRRQGLSMLFLEQPDRVWRTRELAEELERRGWGGPSGNESNKVSRVLSLMVSEGEIERVGKQGRYKLRTGHSESRPQTLEEEASL
jgi:hypothetical protein